MRITIVGAGPAGLYAAILLRQKLPDAKLTVLEQNAPDATFGFGVVFSDEALSFLNDDDPDTHRLIAPHMERWSDIDLSHRGETIRIDGIGFAAIGRLRLLQLLRRRAADLGIEPHYHHRVASLGDLEPADLIIGADGLNSMVRASDPRGFGETMAPMRNAFVWYGADRPFDRLTQSFVDTELGRFNAHHYRYASTSSTFIVECDAATWEAAGFQGMSEEASRVACEHLFAPVLDGASLIGNNSTWRRFPKLWNNTWFAGNKVLVGDALHTCHFSIGSGTRLALEDVIALVRALGEHVYELPSALAAYQAARQPIVEKLFTAANASASWYEDFAAHMDLDPWPFALSYMQRTGRIDAARLRRLAPRFADQVQERGFRLSD
jgi:2-polyprenyl-6-methoxyphenol hydroxylase-like FAD-dependent oxidoreductase